MDARGAARAPAAGGFSLVEVLVASGILSVALLALAPLFVIAAAATREAMHATQAVLLASQKIDELRACCADPPLPASPSRALEEDTPPYVEYLDGRGRVIGVAPPAPAAAVYTRRWSVAPLATHAGAAVVLQVIVTPHRAPLAAGASAGRRPGEARLITLLGRRVP